MNAITQEDSVRRISSTDEIVRILGLTHPHVTEASWFTRQVERQRINQSIRAEEHRLEFCLVVRTDAHGKPQCGALAAAPKASAGTAFDAYGEAPIFFGFLFGFNSYSGFSQVFEEVAQLAREWGRVSMVGPFEATINYSCGLLEKSPDFPIGVLMPDNPIEWNEYFPQFGFAEAERLFTYEIELANTRFRRLAERLAPDLTLTVKELTPPFSPEQRAAVAEVFNSGWRGNWGFVPLDVDFIESLEKEFTPLLWPGLSSIVYQQDRPIGILIAIPDLNEVTLAGFAGGPFATIRRLWSFFARRRPRALRILILGLVQEFHRSREGAGVVEFMLDWGKAAAERYGARYLQFGWTLSSNHRVNRLAEIWAPEARRVTHRLWAYSAKAS